MVDLIQECFTHSLTHSLTHKYCNILAEPRLAGNVPVSLLRPNVL